ncbi:hypothetical protein ACJJTC_001625 [Scirpophaga incertulas]
MSTSAPCDDFKEPKTLQEAINIIKFIKTTHKHEIKILKEKCHKQAETIKKLEENRKKELEFLSTEIHKYEIGLALRSETVREQLEAKDDIIKKQSETIEELQSKLLGKSLNIPEIVIDSNSDSGVVMENEENSLKVEETKPETKSSRKYSKRFTDPISFFRRVDFSPIKYNNKEGSKKKNTLDVPRTGKRIFNRQSSTEKPISDDERNVDDSLCSDSPIEPIIVRPKNLNDSLNNHFSDDGSEDTGEEIFDRVMTRSSMRRSVKATRNLKK